MSNSKQQQKCGDLSAAAGRDSRSKLQFPYCNLINVTFFVSGLTVNRKRPEMAEVVDERIPPLLEVVPEFALGEPSGRNWFDTIWNSCSAVG